jgi:hypothetical protein
MANSQETFKVLIDSTISSQKLISDIADSMKVQNARGEHIMSSATTISNASNNIVDVVSQTKRTNLTIEDVLNKLIYTMKIFKFENNVAKDKNNLAAILQKQKNKKETENEVTEEQEESDAVISQEVSQDEQEALISEEKN